MPLQNVKDAATSQNFRSLEKRFPVQGANLGPPAGAPSSLLPTTGLFIGRQVIYKAETGVYWNFAYTGEETYEWAKVGGPPMRDEGGSPSTSSTSYQTTNSPSFTLPLDGEYDISYGAVTVSGASVTGRIGLFVNGSESGSVVASRDASGGGVVATHKTRLTASAGHVVQARYKVDVGPNSAQFFALNLWADPVRVG